MRAFPNILPKKLGLDPTRKVGQLSAPLLDAAHEAVEAVLAKLKTQFPGLSFEEAERRLEEYGPNAVAKDEGHSRLSLLVKALLNPLVVLLSVLATISLLTGDVRAAIVMGLMVVLGVSLRFVQEARADTAAKALRAMIKVTATVLRDGSAVEVPLAELVPGDVVNLAAGDMIPGDVRLLTAKDLFIVQASFTGESLPVEKFTSTEPLKSVSVLELKNVCFLGTSVESGTGTAPNPWSRRQARLPSTKACRSSPGSCCASCWSWSRWFLSSTG
jgi:Mg2+-importing ATPase